MVYSIGEEKFEFKSFNSNYIVWLFSQNEAGNLYKVFVDEKRDELFESLKQMIKVSITDDIIIELTSIFEYLVKFSDIYNVGFIDQAPSIKGKVKYDEEKTFETQLLQEEEQQEEIFEAPVYDNDIFSHVGYTEEKNFGNCFQDIDFFKNIGESTMNNGEKEDSPFENFEYSDDDLGKLINDGINFSRKNSYI